MKLMDWIGNVDNDLCDALLQSKSSITSLRDSRRRRACKTIHLGCLLR